MASEMVERVALAIIERGKAIRNEPSRGAAVALAEAAIEAMREPTAPMVDSGVAFALNVTLSGEYRWTDYVTAKHRHMIDAALQ